MIPGLRGLSKKQGRSKGLKSPSRGEPRTVRVEFYRAVCELKDFRAEHLVPGFNTTALAASTPTPTPTTPSTPTPTSSTPTPTPTTTTTTTTTTTPPTLPTYSCPGRMDFYIDEKK